MNFKYLKNCIIIGLSVFATSQVQADALQPETYNGITQCYVFKNNKLQSQSACTDKGSGFYASYGNTSKITFTAKAFKKPYTVFHEESSEHDYVEKDTLNNKPATTYYRYQSTLKKATKLKIIDIEKLKLLTCSINKQGEDFCYDQMKLNTQ